ncbi:MAG: SDR family oxidoreductase [Dehalococcoidia bacterium]|jgi:NAD(P)-dependent dehydrogenase (short-subunit alcohol dehydrogenase family)|nr:SDR family oxidoreductase [Dehalococcoidia bacterium]MDP7469964.1 SDR family oxidoreductase [Dehalococcoidia bacterium]
MREEVLSLDGKRALVTGGLHPWGKPVAEALAEAGAKVLLATLPAPTTRKVAGKLSGAALPTRPSPTQVRRTVTRAVAGGGIDILVNCYDTPMASPLLDTHQAAWRWIVNANLDPVFLWCREVGGHMLANGGGRIINLASGLGERGLGNCTAYCAAMAGVISFTRSLGLEWAGKSVAVNAMAPCWFEDTPLAEAMPKERLARFIPAKRLGKIEEVGAMAAFLASDAASYITGQTYFLSGGVMAHA